LSGIEGGLTQPIMVVIIKQKIKKYCFRMALVKKGFGSFIKISIAGFINSSKTNVSLLFKRKITPFLVHLLCETS
jgi:hypothetical protein